MTVIQIVHKASNDWKQKNYWHSCDKERSSPIITLPMEFVCFWFKIPPPQWARTYSFTRFLDHTQRRTTFSRTPLGT